MSNSVASVIPERAQRESGIHFSQQRSGAMDSGPAPNGASRNDDVPFEARLSIPATEFARVMPSIVAPTEGAGNAGRFDAPAASCVNKKHMS